MKYFVLQAFINGLSIKNIAKCILSFTINIHFYEAIILSIDLIHFNTPSERELFPLQK
jgi:hypothetical protein